MRLENGRAIEVKTGYVTCICTVVFSTVCPLKIHLKCKKFDETTVTLKPVRGLCSVQPDR